MFETVSLARLRIQGWMIENARFLAEGKICICAIPLSVEKEIGVTEDDITAAIYDSVKLSVIAYEGSQELVGMKGE